MTPEQETLITRIKEMEDRYQEVTRVLGELDMAIEEYNDFKDELATLKDYMESGQWKKDFESDEAGLVPADPPEKSSPRTASTTSSPGPTRLSHLQKNLSNSHDLSD